MLTIARVGPGQRQEPGIQSVSTMWVSGPQKLELSPTALRMQVSRESGSKSELRLEQEHFDIGVPSSVLTVRPSTYIFNFGLYSVWHRCS